MQYKIIGGEVSDSSTAIKAKHRHKSIKLKAIVWSMGLVHLRYADDWGGSNNVDISYLLRNQVTGFQLVTEQNRVNFTGAAGWGIIGGVLTGGVGLLAGALLGGRGTSQVFAIAFTDGTQLLCQGSPKDIAKFQMKFGLLGGSNVKPAPDQSAPLQEWDESVDGPLPLEK